LSFDSFLFHVTVPLEESILPARNPAPRQELPTNEWIECLWPADGCDNNAVRVHKLYPMLKALLLQRIFSIPTDSLLIIFLKYSQELRDFCGFSKVPDASKFTRFKQDFQLELQSMFDHLVDLTEPVCQQIDQELISRVFLFTQYLAKLLYRSFCVNLMVKTLTSPTKTSVSSPKILPFVFWNIQHPRIYVPLYMTVSVK